VPERDLAAEADEDVESEQGDEVDRDEGDLLRAEVRESARQQGERDERGGEQSETEG
jgi:hypothetical protein